MKPASKVDLTKMNYALKALNEAGVGAKIRIVGISKEEKLTRFVEIVGGLAEEQQSVLPNEVVDLYNEVVSYDPASEPPEDEKEKEKEEAKPRGKGGKEMKEFMWALINEGKYTRGEIVEMTLVKFPGVAKTTIGTLLSDGKNPNRQTWEKPTVVGAEDKIIRFAA